MLIESISGIRGIINESFNDSTIRDYANAYHHFCSEGKIVIGRDSRPSGADFALKISKQLTDLGRTVIDCGIVPTPSFEFIVDDPYAVGGIIVTASHNPSEWNGLKFLASDGCFLNREEFDSLFSMKGIENKKINSVGNRINYDLAINDHISRICDVEWIHIENIKSRGFRVAIDTVNGAAAFALPRLLSILGCEVVSINCETSGNFTRGTEPLPENLQDLSKLVLDSESDLGFATDPDADRLAVINNKGKAIGEESTLMLAVDSFLNSNNIKSPIVTNLSTTLAIEKVSEKHGVKVLRSAVGEINLVEMMKEHSSKIGGEGNGGVILKDVHLGRDSLVAATIILHRIALANTTLSTLMENLPQFEIVKEKILIDVVEEDALFDMISASCNDAEICQDDGLKLSWKDRWVHIRKSNTEPILRLYAEAPTLDEANNLGNFIKTILSE